MSQSWRSSLPSLGSDKSRRMVLLSMPVSRATLEIIYPLSLARRTFSKYELVDSAATLIWPLRNRTGLPLKLDFKTFVFVAAGIVDLLARLRAIITAIRMRGIPVRGSVDVDTEGNTETVRNSATLYATADQKRRLRDFKAQLRTEVLSSPAID